MIGPGAGAPAQARTAVAGAQGGGLRTAGRLARIAALAAGTLARTARGAGDAARGTAILAGAVRQALEIHQLQVHASGPEPRGPALLVSNHLSYLDPLVLISRVPCVPIAKAELASWPVFGALARRTGVLFVARGSAGSRLAVLRAAEQALRSGAMVLNFPEGTTTDGATVLPFRKGLFEVARVLRVPVVPAALRYAPPALAWIGDATFVPHYLRFARLERSSVEVAFGEPIASHEYADAEALAGAARACTVSLLEGGTAWLRKAR